MRDCSPLVGRIKQMRLVAGRKINGSIIKSATDVRYRNGEVCRLKLRRDHNRSISHSPLIGPSEFAMVIGRPFGHCRSLDW